MIKIQRKKIFTTLILIAMSGLTACSAAKKVTGFFGEAPQVNYQNNQSVKSLEVPPDLTSPEFDSAFVLPAGDVSAVALKNGTSMNQSNAVRKVEKSSVKKIGEKTVLQVNSTYSRALPMTEAVLTLMGFRILSKSAAGDVINASYEGENIAIADRSGSGFLSRVKIVLGTNGREINSNEALNKGETYVISIKNEASIPIVRFTRSNQKGLSEAAHAKIMSLLNTAFNQ